MQIMDNPYPETPGQKQFALDKVRRLIESWQDAPSEFRDLVLSRTDQFIERKRENAPDTVHFYGGQMGWTHWVIKDDELNLLGQLGPAAMGIVTFLSVANAPVAVVAFGLALSIAGIAKKIKTKSVAIDSEDYYILMTLKQAGPSTVSRLAEVLGGLHLFGSNLWDDARTLAALNKLKQVPQNDGSTTALVNESSDGRWSVSGI